jgi:hypothetical protein
MALLMTMCNWACFQGIGRSSISSTKDISTLISTLKMIRTTDGFLAFSLVLKAESDARIDPIPSINCDGLVDDDVTIDTAPIIDGDARIDGASSINGNASYDCAP